MHTDLVEILLWRALAIFLLIGALLGVALGLLLIFKPQLLERINRVANRWVSTRHINQWLDRSISIERWFYRHHRPLGLAIILGAGYILVDFSLLFDKASALQHLPRYLPASLMGVLLDVLKLVMLFSSVVALLVGFVIWLRPSLLRGMEKEANQWVSSRSATKALDVPHAQVDPFVMRHAQSVGWLLSLGSIYLFFVMFRFLV
ncbi:MAG TPA: hypothetical protein VF296_01630 [Gallionella sp.]